MIATIDRDAAWADLARPSQRTSGFQPEEDTRLPNPARRLLTRSLPVGDGLPTVVVIAMEGEIKLKKWMPFRASQVVRIGSGFVWRATVGKAPVVFNGGDVYWRDRGSLDFRLWGIVPVARAAGPDIDRSNAGRLAIETVAWAPQALTPTMGATWVGIDDAHAVASVPVGEKTIDVTVTVDADGNLRELEMQRWDDPDGTGDFGPRPFGGAIDALSEFDGIRIATEGRVGWWWGGERQEEGEFFRYRITDAHFPTQDDPPERHRNGP